MIQLNHTCFLRSLHLFNHIVIIYGLSKYSVQWLMVSWFFWFLYGSFGISITFHRCLSHQSFKMNRIFRYMGIVLGCFSFGGSPITWVGTHRMHHSEPDGSGDPHSIRNCPWWRIYLHMWKPFTIKRRYIRDLLKDDVLMWVHQNYILIVLTYVGLLYACDIRIGIFACSGAGVMGFHAFALVNTLGHSSKEKNQFQNDYSRNSILANFISWGEGWHRNHHLIPTSYRFGFKWYQFDLSAFLIEWFPFLVKNREKLIKDKNKYSHIVGL